MNRNHHETYKKALSKEKREKYLIEEVELTTQEASDLGVAEAYYILNPPAKKQAQSGSTDSAVVKMLMEQNQMLMERLAVIESKNETPKPPKK